MNHTRLLSFVISLSLILAAVGCGGQEPSPAPPPQPTEVAPERTTPEQEPAPATMPPPTAAPAALATASSELESTGGDSSSGGGGSSSGGGAGGSTGETCCERDLVTPPFALPEGENDASGRMLAGAFNGVFPPNASDCPVKCFFNNLEWTLEYQRLIDAIGEVVGSEPDPAVQQALADMTYWDYVVFGAVTIVEQTGYLERYWDEETGDWEGGFYEGTFRIDVELIDPHHGVRVASGSTMCIGGAQGLSGCHDAVEELARSFAPLTETLHSYERLPESVNVQVEEDSVDVGKEATIELREIRDSRGQTAKDWWRIFVEVSQGEILEAPEKKAEFSVFRVGDGSVDVKYKAPEECPTDRKVTVKVYNTCNKEERYSGVNDRQIATYEFEINCYELEFQHSQSAELGASAEIAVKGRIPLHVRRDGERGTVEGSGTVVQTIAGGGGIVEYLVGESVEVPVIGGGCRLMEPATCDVEVEIEGDVEGDVFYLTIEERWSVDCRGTLTCATQIFKEEEVWTEPFEIPPSEHTFDIRIADQDGAKATKSYDYGFAIAEYKWILHNGEE